VHELSLCGAIAEIAQRRSEGRSIQVIHLRVGELRQVVPETLAFCWEMVTAQTDLEGSALAIDRIPATVRCHECEHTGPLGQVISLACPACAGIDVEVLAGEEFDITAMDLAVA
jgi:hydrogenase nickel incorporation protein HypA/HybF